MNWRYAVLVAVVVAVILAMALVPPIPQSEAYHNFADRRAFLGISNFFDSLSNLFFLLVGALGIRFTMRDQVSGAFITHAERAPYLIFFLAVALTAFGSAYYHLAPSDARLLWDRLPMSLGFASLLAAVICERISVRAGMGLLVPLLFLGAASVLYWNFTQSRGYGDLRPYAVTQFGSLAILLLLLGLFPPRYTRDGDFIVSLGFYALAKILEAADRPIFAMGGIVSGHTLKHVTAAISAYWILRMLRLRKSISAPAPPPL
jgi:hypothetical protein